MNIKNLLSALVMTATMFGSAGLAIAADEPAAAGYSLQDLLVTPTRVLFEGNMPTTELALVNRSDKAHTYAISFVQCRMSENGEIKEIEKGTPADPNDRFADTFVRFTPRRVILEPRQVQMVRMMLRKPSDLADGEYRSHLSFRLIPTAENAVKPDSVSRGIQIKLVPIYGVTIPVIVRHGSLTATARLSGIHIDPKGNEGKPALALTIEREGTRSTYGDIEVLWKGPGSKALSVALIKGIAVYTPNAKRTMIVALTTPKGVEIRGGELTVRYTGQENGAERLLAESRIAIP
jgi:P pilus assembly chaperone PapD